MKKIIITNGPKGDLIKSPQIHYFCQITNVTNVTLTIWFSDKVKWFKMWGYSNFNNHEVDLLIRGYSRKPLKIISKNCLLSEYTEAQVDITKWTKWYYLGGKILLSDLEKYKINFMGV